MSRDSDAAAAAARAVEVVGRYSLHAPIARGGMAIVHLARVVGPEGFRRVVAAKRLMPHYVQDAGFVAMFLDEARIASKIHHPNVVPVLDVVLTDREVILVQEYVHGVPLDQILRLVRERGDVVPPEIAISVLAGLLDGLHAAHEARDEAGEPLSVVHRDVTPHNVIVSIDGVTRVLDFGIAKARSSSHVTREGVFKGKLAYLSPEQIGGGSVTRAADVYGAGVVAWEVLANRRLFAPERMDATQLMVTIVEGRLPTIAKALDGEWSRLTAERRRAVERLQPVLTRALATEPALRFPTTRAMREALTAAWPPASLSDVASWLKRIGREPLESRREAIRQSEEASRSVRFEDAAPVSSSRVFVSRASRPGPSGPPVAYAPAPTAPGSHAQTIVVALSLLAVFLFAWLAGRSGDDPSRGQAAPPSAAYPPSVAPPTPTVAPTVAPSAPSAASPPPVEAPSAPEPSRAPSAPEPSRAPVVHAPPRTRSPDRPPAHEAPRSDSSPAPSPAAECSPPYFFEGTKKVFKPGCL